MNIYLVTDAISCLDADLLEKHLEKKKKLKAKLKNRKKMNLVRWSVMATCICLVVAVSIVVVPYVQKVVYESQMRQYNVGATVKKNTGTLTYNNVDAENHICSFTLIKADDSPIYFKFCGYIVEKEWTDEQGVERKKAQQVDVITPYIDYSPDNGREVLDIDLVITVNGIVVDTIPSEAGEYEITIDYDELYNVLDHVDDVVEVYKFGYFNLMETEQGG